MAQAQDKRAARNEEGALLIRWGAPIHEREVPARRVLEETIQFFADQAKQGQIAEHREWFSTSTRDYSGFELVTGEYAGLVEVMASEAFQEVLTRLQVTYEGVDVALLVGGNEPTIRRHMDTYDRNIKDLVH